MFKESSSLLQVDRRVRMKHQAASVGFFWLRKKSSYGSSPFIFTKVACGGHTFQIWMTCWQAKHWETHLWRSQTPVISVLLPEGEQRHVPRCWTRTAQGLKWERTLYLSKEMAFILGGCSLRALPIMAVILAKMSAFNKTSHREIGVLLAPSARQEDWARVLMLFLEKPEVWSWRLSKRGHSRHRLTKFFLSFYRLYLHFSLFWSCKFASQFKQAC